jgi:hypothetical protein
MKYKSLDQLSRDFSRFEKETTIYKENIDGIPFWEISRFDIFQRFAEFSGLLEVGHQPVPRSFFNYFRYSNNILKSWMGRLKPFAQSDCLVLGHPRLVSDLNGLYHDPYSEAYLDQCELTSTFLERAFRGQHYGNRKSHKQRIWVDDKVFFSSRKTCQLSLPKSKYLKEVSRFFYEITGVWIDIEQKISAYLGRRSVLLPFYINLLKKIRPKFCIAVPGYQCPELIEACRQFGLPLIEIHHGVISNYHYGYHHEVDKPTFYYPDHLWLWGDYWRDAAKYPDKTNLDVLGFPLFERHRHLQIKKKSDSCLFISQGSIGRKISEKAIELRKKKPYLDIYFKLHPSEFDNWEAKYKHLSEYNITLLGKDSGSLYDWLGRTRFVVGGYSTALFEAACLGCRVGVLDLPGIEYMHHLLNRKGAYSIENNIDEFFLDDHKYQFDIDSIFKPFSENKVNSLLNQIISH